MTIDYKAWTEKDMNMAGEAGILADRGYRIRDPDRVFQVSEGMPVMLITCPLCEENPPDEYMVEVVDSLEDIDVNIIQMNLYHGTYITDSGSAACEMGQYVGKCPRCKVGVSYWPDFYPVEDWSWAVGIETGDG